MRMIILMRKPCYESREKQRDEGFLGLFNTGHAVQSSLYYVFHERKVSANGGGELLHFRCFLSWPHLAETVRSIDNKNAVISLFEKAHLHVIPHGEWFITKGKAIKLRYHVGFFIWLGFPLLIFLSAILALLEIFEPGVTQSGQYAGLTHEDNHSHLGFNNE